MRKWKQPSTKLLHRARPSRGWGWNGDDFSQLNCFVFLHRRNWYLLLLRGTVLLKVPYITWKLVIAAFVWNCPYQVTVYRRETGSCSFRVELSLSRYHTSHGTWYLLISCGTYYPYQVTVHHMELVIAAFAWNCTYQVTIHHMEPGTSWFRVELSLSSYHTLQGNWYLLLLCGTVLNYRVTIDDTEQVKIAQVTNLFHIGKGLQRSAAIILDLIFKYLIFCNSEFT